MQNNDAPTKEPLMFAERLNRVETAVALQEPDKVPVCPFDDSWDSKCREIFAD